MSSRIFVVLRVWLLIPCSLPVYLYLWEQIAPFSWVIDSILLPLVLSFQTQCVCNPFFSSGGTWKLQVPSCFYFSVSGVEGIVIVCLILSYSFWCGYFLVYPMCRSHSAKFISEGVTPFISVGLVCLWSEISLGPPSSPPWTRTFITYIFLSLALNSPLISRFIDLYHLSINMS